MLRAGLLVLHLEGRFFPQSALTLRLLRTATQFATGISGLADCSRLYVARDLLTAHMLSIAEKLTGQERLRRPHVLSFQGGV
jgi:hypothetical protein